MIVGTSKYHQISPSAQGRTLKFLSSFIPKNFDTSHDQWNKWNCDEDSATKLAWTPMRAFCCYQVYHGDFTFTSICNEYKVSTPTKKIINRLLNSILDEMFEEEDGEEGEEEGEEGEDGEEGEEGEEEEISNTTPNTTLTLKLKKFYNVSSQTKTRILDFLSPLIPENFGPHHEQWNIWNGDNKWTPMRAFICSQAYHQSFVSVDSILTTYTLDPNVFKKRITIWLSELYREFNVEKMDDDDSSTVSHSAMSILIKTATTELHIKKSDSVVVPESSKPCERAIDAKTAALEDAEMTTAVGNKVISLDKVKNVYPIHFLQPDLVAHFTCCVCKYVAIDPVACNNRECDQNWCFACIRTMENIQCATCNTPLTNIKMNPLIRKVLDSKLIACPMGVFDKKAPPQKRRRRNHASMTCGWTGALVELRQHIEEDCGLVVMTCKQCGCSILRGDYNAHDLECTGRAVPCRYCKKDVFLGDHHDCKQKCFYAGVGCGFGTYCARDMEKHESEAMAKHLRLMTEKMMTLSSSTSSSPTTTA